MSDMPAKLRHAAEVDASENGESEWTALYREAASWVEETEEALIDLRANHALAAGIIKGAGFKHERPDLMEHAERMLSNLDLNDHRLSRTGDGDA